MRSTLIIFVLSPISILTDLKVADGMEPDFSLFDLVKSPATTFLFETLAVAAGEHFVRGNEFDLPSREDQKVAVIFGTTPEQRADTPHVHYSALKSAILEDPQLKYMFDEESERLRQQNLPSLKSARLNLLKFLQYGVGVTKDRLKFEWPYGYVLGLTALGILQLSQTPEVGELTQQTYDRALEGISSKLGNETRKTQIDEMIFTIIENTFQKDENLNTQLGAKRSQISRSILLQ